MVTLVYMYKKKGKKIEEGDKEILLFLWWYECEANFHPYLFHC